MIFISYAHRDREKVSKYLDEFRARGLPVWFDGALEPGVDFNDEIADAISGCEAFVLFLSSSAVASRYVIAEVNRAWQYERRIIAIHLEPDVAQPSGMEMKLGGLHQLNFGMVTEAEAAERIAEALGLSRRPGDGGEPELLKKCRETFSWSANRLGLADVGRGVDPMLFCPVVCPEGSGEPRSVDLLEEIAGADRSHILLQADGGLGKTYAFLYAAHRLLESGKPCAYIPCYQFTGDSAGSAWPVLELLRTMYFPEADFADAAGFSRFLKRQRQGRFVLFLDGYNEAAARDRLAAEIVRLSDSVPDLKLVVSSRVGDASFASFRHFTMTGLDDNNLRGLLAKAGRSYDGLGEGLKKLLHIPMFLSLYLHLKQTRREIDTAAGLMDQERIRVLDRCRRAMVGADGGRYAVLETVLNGLFPDFVQRQYETNQRELPFTGGELMGYLESRGLTEKQAAESVRFLKDYSIIHESDRAGTYVYRHEHFRDYWVAYAVFRRVKGLEGEDGERTRRVLSIFEPSFSEIVLRYEGELLEAWDPSGPLYACLGYLRREHFPTEEAWRDPRTAGITARIIEIMKIVTDGQLPGVDLEGLNLTLTRLNRVRTCTKSLKARFDGALISEQTFIMSMHESAPRCAVPMELDGRDYLITVSNEDLLISVLPGMETCWRYPHRGEDGSPETLPTLVGCAALDGSLMAVDAAGGAWEWDFAAADGAPVCLRRFRRRELERALRLAAWSDEEGPLLALQAADTGEVLTYARFEGEDRLQPLGSVYPEGLAGAATARTFTSDPGTGRLYWATADDAGIRVWAYDAELETTEELCTIDEHVLEPDLMECSVGEKRLRKEAGTDGEEPLLFLSCVSPAYTKVYQIRPSLKGRSGAALKVLAWGNGLDRLVNDYNMTKNVCDRVKSMCFCESRMLAAASDGCLYSFVCDGRTGAYGPDPAGDRRMISKKAEFALLDACFLPGGRAAAVSVDRSVHLLEVQGLFPAKCLPGYNDGLRKLMVLDGRRVLATTYDGYLLELVRREGEEQGRRRRETGAERAPAGQAKARVRYVCRNKHPVGDWYWSLAEITDTVFAAGSLSTLALIDIERDRTLFRADELKEKVETLCLVREPGDLLLAGDLKGVTAWRVSEEGDGFSLERAGSLRLPEGCGCYWMEAREGWLYIAVNTVRENTDMDPKILRVRLDALLTEEAEVFFAPPAAFGRVRDLRFLGEDCILAVGPCEDAYDERSSVCYVLRLGGGRTPEIAGVIRGFDHRLLHSAVRADGEGAWRIALIDSTAAGRIYRYRLELPPEGGARISRERELSLEMRTQLCDIAFDARGDLLISCLNGFLCSLGWEDGEPEKLFRNKCYMLTYGAKSMSRLADPVDLTSKLGWVLMDFDNTGASGRVPRKRM